jgi:citrate synthase
MASILVLIYAPEWFIWLVAFLQTDAIMFLYWTQRKSNKQTNDEFKKQKNNYVESGNAITDAMKVAYDNLKQQRHRLDVLKKNLADLNARLHRLEQQRSRDADRKLLTISPTVEEETIRKIKTQQKNERRDEAN